MANGAVGAVRPADLGVTTRKDAWWVQPLVVFLALSAFVVYATWAAFQGNHYRFGPYLSPFYSPELFGDPKTAWFGAKPGWWPVWLVFSPALLILPFPAGFRVTCYYYRGAYYKAFWADPPSCTVGEPRSHYRGESSLPLIIQNVHRYFLYIALVVHPGSGARRLGWRVVRRSATGVKHFGMGVGSLVLIANVVLLARLHLRLPFAAAPGRRQDQPAVAMPGALAALRLRQLFNRATWAGRGSACSALLSPMSMSGCVRWASSRTGGSSKWPIRDPRARCPGHRRRRRRVCAPPSRPRPAASRSAWSASRCWARPTPSWPRAASPRRWPTSTTATAGRSTSPTPCAAASTSTTGAWPSCTPRKRRTACASWRPGARSSTAPTTAASCSATSAATATRAWPTSATAPAWR